MSAYYVPAYASEIETGAFFANDAITEEIPIVKLVQEPASTRGVWTVILLINLLIALTGAGTIALGMYDSEYRPVAYEACTKIAYQYGDTTDDFLMNHFKCDSGIANEVLAHPYPQPKRREYILQLQELITPLEAGSRPGHGPLEYCQVIMGGFFRELGPAGDGRIVAAYHAPPYTSLIPGTYEDCKGGEIILRSARGFR